MLSLFRRFRKAHEGMAAVEFAMILPIMMVLVFGAIEITSSLICKTNISNTASTAADLISQESSIGTTDINNVFSALSALTYPFSTTGLRIVITSAVDDGKGGAKVDWSKANTGAGRTPQSAITVPAGLVTTGGSVIVAEVTYTYTPPSTWFVQIPISMSNTFYSHPRRVPQIKWTS